MPALAPAFSFAGLTGHLFKVRPAPPAQTSRQEFTVKIQGMPRRDNGGWGHASIREVEQLAVVALVALPGVSCDACEAKYPWPRLHGRRGTSTPPDRDAVSSSARDGSE